MREGSIRQRGPHFLALPASTWPILKETDIKELPERKVVVNIVIQEKKDTLVSRIDINRFSKYQKLINTTARILNLYHRFKKDTLNEGTEYSIKELNPDAINKAEKLWVVDAQKTMLEGMRNGKLDRLCPNLHDGVIYVGGRASKVIRETWNQQGLILLPYDHRFSRLIAENEHVKGGHLGVAASVARVRLKYWIVRIFNMMKNIRFTCVIFRRKQKLLSRQQMADLPLDRLIPSPPFHNTGLDYFGPLTIKGEVNKRARGKCFGVVFTCFVTRAVYLDICVNYSTDAFMQTLRRFVSVHGWPKRFHSDNGTSQVATSKELRECVAGLEFGVIHGNQWT